MSTLLNALDHIASYGWMSRAQALFHRLKHTDDTDSSAQYCNAALPETPSWMDPAIPLIPQALKILWDSQNTTDAVSLMAGETNKVKQYQWRQKDSQHFGLRQYIRTVFLFLLPKWFSYLFAMYSICQVLAHLLNLPISSKTARYLPHHLHCHQA